MSIIEAACIQVLSDIKKWRRMNQDVQYQTLENAYKLFSRQFIEALAFVQRYANEINIQEGKFFIQMRLKREKQILFLNDKNKVTGFDCTCQVSWMRKSQNNCSLLCKHELIYFLYKYCFKPLDFPKKITQNEELSKLIL